MEGGVSAWRVPVCGVCYQWRRGRWMEGEGGLEGGQLEWMEVGGFAAHGQTRPARAGRLELADDIYALRL